MGTKSVHLEDDVHIKMNEIQLSLSKMGIVKTIYQIHDVAVRYGIDNAFEFIKNSEKKVE